MHHFAPKQVFPVVANQGFHLCNTLPLATSAEICIRFHATRQRCGILYRCTICIHSGQRGSYATSTDWLALRFAFGRMC